MGLGAAGAQVQAWEEIRKSSQDDKGPPIRTTSTFKRAFLIRFYSFICCSANPSQTLSVKESSARDSSHRAGNSGSSRRNSSAPAVAPNETLTKSDVSANSDATESSVVSKTEEELVASSKLRRFTFTELKLATRNFRPDSFLGEGGFGCVFKGWVDENGTAPVKPGTGLTVAVKTLNHNGPQGHKEWLAEITFLGQLHHANLVKLIGFCIEDDQRLLVYEFMQRGSLENHLFRRALPLPWNTRMKIALGAARGVEFLHNRAKPVIYRDFKTSNILLDAEYTAKLSDFGLAKDGPQGDKTHVSTRVMGTYGYAAPEYVMTGHLSTKSDVYSFGVVLLEMLTGKRSLDKTRPVGEHHLAEWARPYLSDRRKVLRIIDPRLEGHYSVRGAQKAGQLAYQCLHRDGKPRPSMTDVVKVLEQIQNLKDMANAAYHSRGQGESTRTGSSAHKRGSRHGSVLPPHQATPSRG
ncbi:hypothetical protein KP509_04G073700 [Ceratopteris richardii]|uniref:non-specific serine/threonine protein kinase n=2 Tax=Ceratopteris richardii TaxID=49495 RepID=A0A8T2UU26_CERRI|nr:hypothetical protein KP509_04G073700 [Ceratopteris richardii]KAH7439722.1 hypothetical protein KP509_04G073700 [Ceratopteris richardii]